jgi:hypothetical protein
MLPPQRSRSGRDCGPGSTLSYRKRREGADWGFARGLPGLVAGNTTIWAVGRFNVLEKLTFFSVSETFSGDQKRPTKFWGLA